jgi:hypothetical protein
MLEIPFLNTVYEDEYVTVLIHDIAGEGKLLVVHVDIIPSTNKALIKHYFDVITAIFDGLKEKGVKEVEAWVNTDEEARYAQFFGFTEWVGELTVNGQTCLPHVFRMKRVLD